MIPYAKGGSAKSYDFVAKGEERHTDFHQAMETVKGSGCRGYVGTEHEGRVLSEVEGIKATQALLKKVFEKLA